MDSLILWSCIQGDPELAKKCLLLLYELQTKEEQHLKNTQEVNYLGFNTADAPIMSMYAELIQQGVELTAQQHKSVVKRLLKYCHQLIKFQEITEYIR